MKIKSILMMGILALFVSCSSNEEGGKSEVAAHNEETETATHHHEGQEHAITLNHGEKWKVDQDMMGYIHTMEKLLNDFNGSSLSDYQTLSAEINKNLDLLTSNCTMTGPAHDELHKWLLPFIEEAGKLSKAETKSDAEESYRRLKESFNILNTYFR